MGECTDCTDCGACDTGGEPEEASSVDFAGGPVTLCDHSGGPAEERVRVTLESGGRLYFCRHHGRQVLQHQEQGADKGGAADD